VRELTGTAQQRTLDACKYQVSRYCRSVTINLQGIAGKVTTATFEMRINRTNPSTWFVDDLQVRYKVT
jgi:hypothetical protein